MGRPIASAAYFVTFILLGTMIMLNLFTGVIINSMQEAQAHHDETIEAEQIASDIPGPSKLPANLGDVDDKLRIIADQLLDVSKDIAVLKERMT